MAKFDLNTWGQSYLQSDNSIYIYQCMLVVHLHRFFEEKRFFKFESHSDSDHPKKISQCSSKLSLESWCRNTSPKSKAFRFKNNPMSKHNHCHSFIRQWVIPKKKWRWDIQHTYISFGGYIPGMPSLWLVKSPICDAWPSHFPLPVIPITALLYPHWLIIKSPVHWYWCLPNPYQIHLPISW